MILKKAVLFKKGLEDPLNPLLGPTLRGLYLFGLWQTGSKIRIISYNLFHFTTFLFVISQFIDVFSVRDDFNKVLNNMSLTALSVICVTKCSSYIFQQSSWKELVAEISGQEIRHIKKRNKKVLLIIANYIKYTRTITYMFWMLVFVTNLLLILSPLLKYLSSTKYREEIKKGLEPLPQILCSWFPIDTSKMPGYFISIAVHIVMSSQGSGVLAVYDMNAVAIMSYLKGQLTVLKVQSEAIFERTISRKEVLDNIIECHRHHTVLLKHYTKFKSLLSPTMFLYVFVCSITMCCSVVQFSSGEATTSQKIWVIQYTTGQVAQLFLYCWHSNEVTIQSREVSAGLYASEWWKGDKFAKRHMLLLAGKLSQPFILEAGPFTTLSLPTFIDIIKGSYSFYTLFSQIQNK